MSEALVTVEGSTHFPQPKVGRRSTFTRAIADELLQRISNGEDVMELLAEDRMPAWSTLQRWRQNNPEFALQYARAREASAEAWEHRAWREARTAVDSETSSAARVKVETIKWMAAKRNPRVYADKLLHTGGDGEGPIQFAVTLNYSALDEDELMTLHRLLAKCTVAQAPRTIEGSVIDGAGSSGQDISG